MNARRLLALTFLAGTIALGGEPEKRLESIQGNLLAAQTYSWRETRRRPDTGELVAEATGRTRIGDLTIARLAYRTNPRVIFCDETAAVEIDGSWARADAIAAAQAAALFPEIPESRRAQVFARYLRRTPPHEILNLVAQGSRALRADTEKIEGTLSTQAAEKILIELAVSGVGGRDGRSKAHQNDMRSTEANAADGGTFSVLIADGRIQRLRLEFGTRLMGEELKKASNLYVFEFFDLGKTEVDVPQAVRELFRPVAPPPPVKVKSN